MQAIATRPFGRQAAHSTSLVRKRWRAFTRNRLAVFSFFFLVLIHLAALLAPVLTPYEPHKIAPANALEAPNRQHLLGTDQVGRDVLTRLLYGGRVSLVVGVAAVAISIIVGILVGAIGGFFGGWADSIAMRFTDAMLSVPTFFLLLLILTIFGGSTVTVTLVIGLTSWMTIARVVRGEILRYGDAEFVLAARSIGASAWRILFLHVLPHTVSAVIVSASLGVANAILTESALSYLGLGVQPPTSTWGNMLHESQQFMYNAPLLSVYPGLAIFATVLAYNFFGDGLRDAFDPRLVA